MPLPKNPKEGETINCPDCNNTIVARLKTYKNNKFPAYVQWQNNTETVAHKTPDGDCKDSTIILENTTESNTSSMIIEGNIVPDHSISTIESEVKAINLKVDEIYSMIKTQFDEYQERKNGSS